MVFPVSSRLHGCLSLKLSGELGVPSQALLSGQGLVHHVAADFEVGRLPPLLFVSANARDQLTHLFI